MKKNEQTGDVELQGVATDDSGVFTENNEAGKIMRDDLTNKMAKQWNITVEDEPQQILGMTLQRNKDGSLTILQPNILDKLFIAIYCDKLDKDPKVNYAKIHIQLTPYKKERTIADKLSPKLDTKGIKKISTYSRNNATSAIHKSRFKSSDHNISSNNDATNKKRLQISNTSLQLCTNIPKCRHNLPHG